MSFSVDLWNSYDFVESNLMLHYRGLKDFIYLLTEKYKYEKTLSEGLKKIYSTNFAVTTFPSLLEGIVAFKSDMLNQYNYLEEFTSGMRDEIINPLNKLSENLLFKMNKNLNEIKMSEKVYNNSVNKLEFAKRKFHESAKEAENFKLTAEFSKNSENGKRDEIRAQNSLKIAKDSENSYISCINETNIIQEEYIETKKKCLNQIQELEEELGSFIKDSLRKYLIFQVAYLRNMQYDVEKKAKLMEDINIKKDVLSFINSNTTNDIPPYKFEFIPYISEYDLKKTSTNDSTISTVRTFISNVFYSEIPEDSKFINNKVQNEIELIVQSIFEGKKIPKELQSTLGRYIRNKRTRKMLLRQINQTRLKGIYTLNDLSFNSIGELLINCLNCLQIDFDDFDYESLKLVINLSTTLFKTASEPNKPRIFLQNYLKEHTIFNKVDFWIKYIKSGIIEEMHNQKNYNIYSNETIEKKDERIKGIVKSQINTSIYDMISFNVKVNIMYEAIQYFFDYYELSDNVRNDLENIVKDYSKKREKEEEDKKLLEEENKKKKEEENKKKKEEENKKNEDNKNQKEEENKNDNLKENKVKNEEKKE